MSLDTWVDCDVAGCRATTGWLRGQAAMVNTAAAAPRTASAQSTEGWDGEGATAFRYRMGVVGQGTDRLSDGHAVAADELDRYADAMDTAKTRMQQARDLALGAGLTVTEREILEPGPQVPTPPPGEASDSPQDKAAKEQAAAAYYTWQEQAKRYAEAGVAVAEARNIEKSAIDMLLDYASSTGQKWHINTADLGTGLAAATLASHSATKAAASTYFEVAKKASAIADDVTQSAATRASAIVSAAKAGAKGFNAFQDTQAQRFGQWINRMPGFVKTFALGNLNQLANVPVVKRLPGLERALPFLSKVPVAGTLLTGGSIYIDADQGKDPLSNVISNGGGFVLGGLAATGIGGVGGAVAGFVTSTGMGWTLEKIAGPEGRMVLDKLDEAGRGGILNRVEHGTVFDTY